MTLNLKPWHAELLFNGYLCLFSDACPQSDNSVYETVHDLFALTDTEFHGYLFHFDPAKYPPNVGPLDAHNASFDKLKRELFQLCSAERQPCANGHYIFAPKGNHTPMGTMYLLASFFLVFAGFFPTLLCKSSPTLLRTSPSTASTFFKRDPCNDSWLSSVPFVRDSIHFVFGWPNELAICQESADASSKRVDL